MTYGFFRVVLASAAGIAFVVFVMYPALKPRLFAPPRDALFRDTTAQEVQVLIDSHPVSNVDTEWIRGYLDGPARGRQLKVSQIDYVRGFVTRVVLATHPGWNCNCQECQEKRGKDGLATQY